MNACAWVILTNAASSIKSSAGVGQWDDFNFLLEPSAINQDKWEFPEQESAGRVGTNRPTWRSLRDLRESAL